MNRLKDYFLSGITRKNLADVIESVYLLSNDKKRPTFLIIAKSEKTLPILKKKLFSIQCYIQDQFYFPDNMIEPFIVTTMSQLTSRHFYNENDLLKHEIRALKKNSILIFGQKLHFASVILNQPQSIQLSPKIITEYSKKYPELQPLLDPFVCWKRHPFVIDRSRATNILELVLAKFKEGIKDSNYYLYGRYWGSGKTGLIYWIMYKCHELQLPFIYRTEFWRDESGIYKKDDEGLNTPEKIQNWLNENLLPNKRIIILLDEVSWNESESLDPHLIIGSGKDVKSIQYRRNYQVMDLMVKYPFKAEEINLLLTNLMNDQIFRIFPRILIRKIATQHHKFRFPEYIKDPTVAIRVATYSLANAVHDYETGKKNSITVTQKHVNRWLKLADSPYIEHYPTIHDVHAEYLIFDGKSYLSVDPFNPGPLYFDTH